MGKFLRTINIVVLAAVLLSIGFYVVYLRLHNRQYPWPEHLWVMPEIQDKYELVKVGNSHSMDGITFERYKMNALSLDRVAQNFEYDLARLKMYSHQIKKRAVILINVSPLSFSESKPRREDSLQTQYYDGSLSPFLIPHLKIEDYLQTQPLAFLRTGFLWREDISNNTQQRIAREEKWPDPTPTTLPIPVVEVERNSKHSKPKFLPAELASPGYFYNVWNIQHELSSPSAAPSDMLVDSMNFMFHKWYETEGFGPQYFDSNRHDLEELISYCLKSEWRPVLISVPISDVLVRGLMSDYMKKYVDDNLKKANLSGVQYFNFQPYKQITSNKYLFSNSDHLNKKGAVIFSYLLLRKLIENGYLPESADGYDYSKFE